MPGPDRNEPHSTDAPASGPPRPDQPTGNPTLTDAEQRRVASRRHSLAKTVSWRVTATIDTFIISYFVTGSFTWASSIASLEVLTKMGLYYLHERAWARVRWGHH